MQTKNLQNLVLFFLLLFMCNVLHAQEAPKPEVDHSYKPLKVKLNEDGSKYLRFIMWHQLWLTTGNLDAESAKLQVTPSIRRSRFLAFAQISPKFLILTHFGLNSLTPANLSSLGSNGNSGKLFLHGAWAELKVSKQLYIGSGLHYWKGMTRLGNASTLNMMTLDQSRPFTQWHSLAITDQFARHLGVYAKGELGKFDYRIAFNGAGQNGITRDYGGKSNLVYNGVNVLDRDGDPTGQMVITGYFRYQFMDKESTKLPYAVGTYLGKKKVFNIGAGFYTHPNGVVTVDSSAHENVNHFAVDAFLELPTEGGAFNAYASFLSFDYGENFLSRWAGTGSAIHVQAGYFFKSAKLMPYVAYQTTNYDAVTDNIGSMDVGLNYFINGHNCKLTLEYHRIMNDFRDGIDISNGPNSLSQLRLQMHVFL